MRPDESIVAGRTARLAALSTIPSNIPSTLRPQLDFGNGKTGLHGRLFDAIRVWNLRPVSTCPGKSPWCAKNCYNADPRSDVFPMDQWTVNWKFVEERPEEAISLILGEIRDAGKRVGVRIHSSGDFYSSNYIKLWIEIVRNSKNAKFWTYTRSWTVPSLVGDLESLRQENNIQMFASWDSSMGKPPANWRLSIISEGATASSKVNLDCPEQYQGGPSCADCGYCINRKSGNVIFHTH